MKTDASVQEHPAIGFDALGLTGKLVETVTALGYEEPTPILARPLVGAAALQRPRHERLEDADAS